MSSLPPKVVRASAGSGKTYQLSSRYLKLLLMGENPDKILATTFTRKAAGEIRDRIFQRLLKAAKSKDESIVLARDLELPSVNQEKVKEVLTRLVSEQHRLLIGTLDSFFSGLAKSFTHEIGLPHQWQIEDTEKTKELLVDATEELCTDYEAVTELIGLIQKNEGSRLVHGVLVDELSKLLKLAYMTSKDIWKLHLSEKSVEMEVVRSAIKDFEASEVPATKKGEKNKNYLKAVEKISGILRGSGNWEEKVLLNGGELFSRIMEGGGDYYKNPVPEGMILSAKPIAQQVRHKILKKIDEKTRALRELVDRILVSYEKLKRESSVISFDDVKRLTFDAAVIRDLSEIFFRIDSKISHILLDEFQDTSIDEWRLIEPIADEVLSYSDGSHSFFCVGDSKQSIYGFRGGVAELFDNLNSRWSHLESDKLEVSRRSSQVVLDFVNKVFSSLDENPLLLDYRKTAIDWKKRFSEHKAHDVDLPGYVEFTDVPKVRGAKPGDDESGPDAVIVAVDKIKELLDNNPGLKIGVLLRSKKLSGKCLYELNKRGIKASGEGGSAIIDSPVVSVLMSYLWLADHPGDGISKFHIARSPLGKALGINKDDSLAKIDALGRQVRGKIYSKGLIEVVKDLSITVDKYCSDRDRAKLSQLIDATINYKSKGQGRLSHFVKYIRELRVPDPEQSSVQVMTIHKSKGLEFDAVFLCDLDGELLKTNRSLVSVYQQSAISQPERVIASVSEKLRVVHPDLEIPIEAAKNSELMNELSVLYVALTRAKSGLYMFANAGAKRSSGKFLANNILAEPDESSAEGVKVIYTAGSSDWASSYKSDESSKPEIMVISNDIKFSRSGTAGIRKLKVITPSEHTISFVYPARSDKARAARDRGLILHKLLENVEWKDIKKKDDIEQSVKLWAINQRIVQKNVKLGLESFEQIQLTGTISELLSQDYYKEWKADELLVETERSFSVVLSGGLAIGTIDRLVLGKKAGKVVFADIIDFKTDSDPSRNLQIHQEQISYYREAVSEMFGINNSNVSAKLVYLQTNEIKIL